MLDRHAVQELLRAGVKPREVARQFQVSRRTVERIAHEAAITTNDLAVAQASRGVGRPRVDAALHKQVQTWLSE